MSYVAKSCTTYVEELASKAAIPGGGGTSALVGAIGMALGNMVGNLTVGKKKYADVEADIIALMEKATVLQNELMRLVDEDAVVFEPLSKAYGIPKDDPNRDKIMEDCLKGACSVPIEIMRQSAKAIELHDEFAKKGSALAISDVGVGVACCKAALLGASLNVYINTAYMSDKEYAAKIDAEADVLLKKYAPMADDIFNAVVAKLK